LVANLQGVFKPQLELQGFLLKLFNFPGKVQVFELALDAPDDFNLQNWNPPFRNTPCDVAVQGRSVLDIG